MSKFTNKIKKIILGKKHYWYTRHNQVFNELLESIKKSNNDIYSPLFEMFIIHISFLLEYFVGMLNSDDLNRIFNFNIKEITQEQYLKMYYILLCFFVFMFTKSNPPLKKSAFNYLQKLTHQNAEIKKLFKKLEAEDVEKFHKIHAIVWKTLVKTIDRPNDFENPEKFVVYCKLVMSRYSNAIEEINELD